MDQLNQYHTPPPYHVDNSYDNTHFNQYNQPSQYDQDIGYNNYDTYNGRDYNSLDNSAPSYNTIVPPYKTRDEGGFLHEDDFNRPFAVSFWVHYFRYIPHLSLSFSRVNNTFNPLSTEYQEVSILS